MSQLTYENNWMSDEYYVDGKRITKLTRVRIGEEVFDVTTDCISIPYNDMGHEYYGTSNHYFIDADVFGFKHRFDLNEIVRKTTVIAIDYSTE